MEIDYKNIPSFRLHEELERLEKVLLEVAKIHERYPTYESEAARKGYVKIIGKIMEEIEKKESK